MITQTIFFNRGGSRFRGRAGAAMLAKVKISRPEAEREVLALVGMPEMSTEGRARARDIHAPPTRPLDAERPVLPAKFRKRKRGMDVVNTQEALSPERATALVIECGSAWLPRSGKAPVELRLTAEDARRLVNALVNALSGLMVIENDPRTTT